MNWADWTFRGSDGTEYAIDAEGNVMLPEGRKIAKGESFTVGPRNAPNVVRIPDGVALNPARRRHSASADFVSLRVEVPSWFPEIERDNERFNLYPGPKWYEGGSTKWTRYSFEGDDLKVEHIDPRTVYYEDANISWNSHGYFLDPPPPYVVYRDPQTRLTPVAVAVKIALDGSVN